MMVARSLLGMWIAVSALGCGISTATSVRTSLEAASSLHEGMEIAEVTEWAGVSPTLLTVYPNGEARVGGLLAVGGMLPPGAMRVYEYSLVDGSTLFVFERRGPDGVARAGTIDVKPRTSN